MALIINFGSPHHAFGASLSRTLGYGIRQIQLTNFCFKLKTSSQAAAIMALITT